MRFMLLINGDESRFNVDTPAEPPAPVSAAFVAYTQAMQKAGAWLGGERLKATRHGARVQIREGRTQVLDGPYVDAKEQLGGYYIIEAPTLEDAVSWAARCPAASYGTIDVRPIAEM